MAELGETTDPRVLIPGDPEALRSWAKGWGGFSSAMDTAHEDLRGVDPRPWQGDARQAYTGYLRTTTPNWTGGSDGYRGAAEAVNRHADTLEWAHGAVATVVDDHAKATTPDAKTAAATELQRIRAQVNASGDDTARALASANPRPPAPQVSTMVAPAAGPGPGGRYSGWDDVPSEHPDPNSINAEGRRVHILWGDEWGGGHHHDSGKPGKTVFPDGWDDDKIMDTVDDVAKNPDTPPRQQRNGSWIAEGTRDGVRVEVIIDEDGNVVTAYPVDGPGVAVNDENGDPQPINPEDDSDDPDGGRAEIDPEEERQEADEEDEDAAWERHKAEEHRRRAEEAEHIGDDDMASEETGAAEESEAGADAAELAADRHRRRAERAEEADTVMVELPW